MRLLLVVPELLPNATTDSGPVACIRVYCFAQNNQVVSRSVAAAVGPHTLLLQAGVRMKQVSSPAKLIYPSSAHDYSYYKSSTVAYFMIDEIKASLCRVLCPPSLAGQGA